MKKENTMIAAIIQARTGSTRFPNKILKKINNIPILLHVIKRIQQSKNIDEIIVATSMKPDDHAITQLCDQWKIKCFQGSEDDVLDRYYKAAKYFEVDTIARVTSDCPLIDYRVVDEVIDLYLKHQLDYASNVLKPFYPDGIDVSVFSFFALEKAWKEAALSSEREHVVPYIQNNSTFHGKKMFKAENYSFSQDFSHIRLTVDEKEDLEVIKFLIERTDIHTPWLTYISLLTKHVEIMLHNSKFQRNEGYQKSIVQDQWLSSHSNVHSNNEIMQKRAKKIIPGMTQLLSKRPDQFSPGIWPSYFSKAKGTDIWDLDNTRYLDMSIAGVGANIHGYADDDVDKAVNMAIRLGTSSSLNCPEDIELAELLCDIHPWADQVRYTRTGGEAMTVAVRIARAATGRDKVAFCGYHGWHDWYLSANLQSENALNEHLLSGLDPAGVPKALSMTAFPFRFNRLEELEEIIQNHTSEIAAIVMEPIRNVQPKNNFLQHVRNLATKIGAVLIFDEISSGFRMNSGGVHLKLCIKPDIAVFSKAIGNGYPISAIIGKKDVMDAVQKSFISSTNWTERVGPTAAIATIQKHIQLNAGDHLVQIGKQIQDGWRTIASRNNINIKIEGIPPLSHFKFEYENFLSMKALFVQLMLEKKILASTLFYAMTAHTFQNVQHYLQELDDVFHTISKANQENSVDRLLKGKPAISGFKRLN